MWRRKQAWRNLHSTPNRRRGNPNDCFPFSALSGTREKVLFSFFFFFLLQTNIISCNTFFFISQIVQLATRSIINFHVECFSTLWGSIGIFFVTKIKSSINFCFLFVIKAFSVSIGIFFRCLQNFRSRFSFKNSWQHLSCMFCLFHLFSPSILFSMSVDCDANSK